MTESPTSRQPLDAVTAAEALQRTVRAGVPLATGLRAYAEECPAASRNGLLGLAETVESGVPVETALESPRHALPPYLAALIRAGLETGQLGTMLEEYLRQQRRSRRVGQQLSLDLIYPLFVIYFSTAIGLLVLMFVVPMFTSIFEDFGITLPSLTDSMIQLSRLVVYLQTPIAVGMLVSGGLLILMLAGQIVLPMLDRSRWLGGGARAASYSEFCSLLAPLVEAQQSLPRALDACARALSHSRLQKKALLLAQKFDGSQSLEDTADEVGMPIELAHLFRWEQRGAAFGQILRSWADLFSLAAEGRSRVMLAWISPVVVVVVGVFIGLLILSLFLPLIRLTNSLS